MQTVWRPFFSYNLWSLFEPAIGQEQRHCPMKRGFLKARAKEPEIATLIQQETVYQEIGLLAQQGIYEFHQDAGRLTADDAVHQVSTVLGLEHRSQEVCDRVTQVLINYRAKPVLLGRNILMLSRGDEGFPQPILLRSGSQECNLFAAIDCIVIEPDGKLHIIDFKTGKSSFDRRQAYVYLLAAQHLYPNQNALGECDALVNTLEGSKGFLSVEKLGSLSLFSDEGDVVDLVLRLSQFIALRERLKRDLPQQ